jgi:integrase
MPRPISPTPGYCLHKRSGRAYLTIAGHQHWLPGPHGSPESRAAYDRLIVEWLQAGRTLPAAFTDTPPTVSIIVAAFWRHAQAHCVRPDRTPTGEAENYRLTLRALRQLYGDIPAADFGPKRLKALREAVTAGRQQLDPTTGATVECRGWSRTYANRQMKRVQQVFRWAASEELVPAAVAAALDTVAGIRKGSGVARETIPVGPVADEVVAATLPFLPPPVRAMVQLQRLTGARGGELFGLRACDLDTDGPVWKFRPGSHKTAHHGKGRVLRFGPQAQAVIRPFLGQDPDAYLFRPIDAVAWRNGRQAAKARTPMTPSRAARAARAKARAVGGAVREGRVRPGRRPGVRRGVPTAGRIGAAKNTMLQGGRQEAPAVGDAGRVAVAARGVVGGGRGVAARAPVAPAPVAARGGDGDPAGRRLRGGEDHPRPQHRQHGRALRRAEGGRRDGADGMKQASPLLSQRNAVD